MILRSFVRFSGSGGFRRLPHTLNPNNPRTNNGPPANSTSILHCSGAHRNLEVQYRDGSIGNNHLHNYRDAGIMILLCSTMFNPVGISADPTIPNSLS